MKQKRYHLDLGDIPFIENFAFSDQLNRLPAVRNFTPMTESCDKTLRCQRLRSFAVESDRNQALER